jgi:hypothetical protein
MAKQDRTPWQAKRDELLAARKLTKADVHAELVRMHGDQAPKVSTVRAALDGRFRNEAVVNAFCALTGVVAAEAFPLDEPPYGRTAGRRNMTESRRSALRGDS